MCISIYKHKRLLCEINWNGSSEHIRVYIKKITNKKAFENAHSTYCKLGKIIYSMKKYLLRKS